MPSMMTIEQFIQQHPDLTFSYRGAGRGPMPASGETQMDKWKCIFQRGERKATFDYYKGVGHKQQPPSAAEVLDALANDARAVQFDGRFQTITVKEFAAEFGYDDPKKAGFVFRNIIDNTQRLSQLFTPQAFKQLIHETESL
jgi:hypothetical protein